MEGETIERERPKLYAIILGPYREPLQRLAQAEDRPMASMIRILLREALAHRGIKVNGEKKAE